MAVYFMRRADGAVKIGHSQNVKMRAKHILYHLDEDYIDIIRTVPEEPTLTFRSWADWLHFQSD